MQFRLNPKFHNNIAKLGILVDKAGFHGKMGILMQKIGFILDQMLDNVHIICLNCVNKY